MGRILLTSLFAIIFVLGQAQNDIVSFSQDQFKIQELVFQGNAKTKKSYILQNIGIAKDSSVSYQELESKINQLARLNGIYAANIVEIEKQESGKIVYVSIQEQRTLLPIVDIGLIQDNSWIQLGFIDINLAGIGDELFSYYRLNEGRHSAQLYYKNNSIANSPWGAHINILRWNSREPLNFNSSRIAYDYINNFIGAGVHYEGIMQHEFTGSSSYFQEKYKRLKEGLNLEGPESLQLNKILNKLEHNYNSFTYKDLLKEGLSLSTRYQNVLTLETKEQFHIGEIIGSYFHQRGRTTNIAIHGHVGFANNYDSPFAPFTIDSYINVRGAGNRVLRGTALLSGNIEWREVIWEKRLWSIQTVAFTDIAFVRKPGRQTTEFLNTDQSRKSIGLGTRIAYAKIYNAMLRVDLAYELTTKKIGLVIGLGQYF